MFSQTAVYALRAMVQLSRVAPAPSSTAAIAESAVVPRAYLSKVLQELRKAGLVRCRRGVGGGVCLAMAPERISILQVVNAVEPVRRFQVSPLLDIQNSCLLPLHQKLDDAFSMLEASLSHTTLAEVAAGVEVGVPADDLGSGPTTETDVQHEIRPSIDPSHHLVATTACV